MDYKWNSYSKCSLKIKKMKNVFYFFIVLLLLLSCKVSENSFSKREKIYVEKIEFKDNFYIINARDSTSKYRIISYYSNLNNSNTIQVGKSYHINLKPIELKSDKLVMNYNHIQRCVKFFSNTKICTEINRELYVTDNLDGLKYYKKPKQNYSQQVLKRISYF